MASIFSIGTTKTGVNTANTVMWQLKAASTHRILLKEMGIFVAVAPTTAPSFVLARSTALGTSNSTIVPEKHDAADAAATAVFDNGWSSAPTFTTAGPYLRQAALPVTAGAGIIWTFADPIVLGVSTGLVIANLNAVGGTPGTFGLSITWDE